MCQDYFPTKAYVLAEKRLGSLLSRERDRLDSLAAGLGRERAIGPDNLVEQVPFILEFAREYHKAYDSYLAAVLPQHPRPIQCRPSCGNCCHHYPMSVEPFELVYLYMNLRKRDDFLSVMEGCQIRATLFEILLKNRLADQGTEDDAEDGALHDYFGQWKPCPFSSSSGDCGIYGLRPVSCRMYFSETDPCYCTPEHLLTERNDSYIVYLPDNIEEAIYQISEHYAGLVLPESFFGGLLAVNGFEGLLADG